MSKTTIAVGCLGCLVSIGLFLLAFAGAAFFVLTVWSTNA